MADIILKAWKDAVGYLMGLNKKDKTSSNLETQDDLEVVQEKDKETKKNKEE